MADVSPFTTLEIAEWSPSDWQFRLPELLAFYNVAVGEGALKPPIYPNTDVLAEFATAAAGDLVYVTDSGEGGSALLVYDGSDWQTVWPASGGGGGLTLAALNINLGATIAANATNIHAVYADDSIDNNFPGPFNAVDTMTVAKPARKIQVQFGFGWLGGAVTVTGLDADGGVIVEEFGPADGVTEISENYFASVTSATKGAVAGIGTSASIGTAEQFQIVPAAGVDFDPDTIGVPAVGVSFGFATALFLAYDISAGISSLTYTGGTAFDSLVATINVTAV